MLMMRIECEHSNVHKVFSEAFSLYRPCKDRMMDLFGQSQDEKLAPLIISTKNEVSYVACDETFESTVVNYRDTEEEDR